MCVSVLCIRFVRAFRERCPADARPVIVHCSAGVGRSGTFITLDRALQQLAAHADTLDVFGMVHAMRRERVWMVQTEQQYICIHQCLVAVLEGQDLAPPHHNHNQHHNPAFEGASPSPRALCTLRSTIPIIFNQYSSFKIATVERGLMRRRQ